MISIPFAFEGDHGTVHIDVSANDNPASVGKTTREHGMPMCTATVTFSARGYRGMLGWVQLVREPSPDSPFMADPFDLFEDSTAPFAWYGLQPTLFDAPSRWRDGPVHWTAHSFLTIGPWDGDRRSVVPLTGFSWGYRQQSATSPVQISPPQPLRRVDWDGHRAFLTRRYPTWTFAAGELAP
ncbi:hypothetical protein [Actinoplanes sp. NPDC051859]|uniref:hypothetical protein n=1 Tax=Actinoplanes sp. NPDC051859 TaxID=3363909 RepID=UPI0037A1B8E7